MGKAAIFSSMPANNRRVRCPSAPTATGGTDEYFHDTVAKVEFHYGELFPRVGFIVTNLGTSSRAVVRFYNKRGTAEQRGQAGGRDDAA